jgi:hypothetical protein
MKIIHIIVILLKRMAIGYCLRIHDLFPLSYFQNVSDRIPLLWSFTVIQLVNQGTENKILIDF